MRFIWILALVPSLALADTTTGSFPMLFDVASNDLSISYLKILFGEVGTVLLGPPNTLVQEIFTVFNLGIMTLAGVLMCYTVVLSVVNTSQEGNPMGHKMSPWVVVRIVAGSAFMMPMSTGYALIQVITMWMVIQGIGFADMIWSKAVDIIAASPTGVYPASAGDDNPFEDINSSNLLQNYVSDTGQANAVIANLFASSLCLEATYQSDLIASKNDGSVSRSDYYISIGADSSAATNSCDGENNICFVTPTANEGDAKGMVCGMHTPPADLNSEDKYIAMNAAYTAAMTINSYVQNIFSDALKNLNDGKSDSEVATLLACINGTFDPSKSGSTDQNYLESCSQTLVLDGIASSYLAALGDAAYEDPGESNSDTSSQAQWAQESKDFGWLSAGAYYASIGASNTGTIDVSTQNRINDLLYKIDTGKTVAFDYGGSNDTNNAKTLYKIFDNYTYQNSVFQNNASNATLNKMNFMDNYFTLYAKRNMKNIADSMQNNTTDNQNSCSYDENAMTGTLDKSIYYLAQNWLKWGGGQSDGADDCSDTSVDKDYCTPNSKNPFAQMNLWARSQLSVAATDDTTYYIGAPQRSLFVLLNRSLSEMLGVKYFDNFAYNADRRFGHGYGDQSDHPYGGHASGWNGVSTFEDACSKGLIDTNGHGLYGQVLATLKGEGYQPLAQMRFMGLHLMEYGVDYFSVTIGELIQTYSKVGLAYWGLSFAFAAVESAVVSTFIYFYSLKDAPSTVPAAAASVAQMLSNVFNSGMNILYQTDQVNITLWQPISAAMAVTYAILGFIMGVYMANVPAIIFVFAAISFFMYVIEAMIASVLVALGLTHPEGHDLLGKAEQSVMLFLAAFIRPAAMIMGLVFSMLLMIPAFRLLNFTFIGLIGEYFEFFGGVDTGSIVPLIGAVGVAFLYAYLSMGIINNCFSLIYQIPDRLLRWLGAPTEPSMIQQMVNEVKGSVTEAAKSAGGGAEGAASSAKVTAQANVSPMGATNEPGKGGKTESKGDADVQKDDPKK